MKIWVIGAEGMLGSVLVRDCLRKKIDVVGTSRLDADVTQIDQLFLKGAQIKPTHIVNCAAYTDVDGAEHQFETAFAVNSLGAANVAYVASQSNMQLIHISTDYVFSGRGSQPYLENDLCAPSNQYGQSKWEGEKKVLEILPQACVLRTSWLFGEKGKNFISSLMNWFQKREELQVVDDQRGRATYCYDCAAAVLNVLNASGVMHFANDGDLSRYQIALDLLEGARLKKIPLKCQRVIPVSSSEFPTLATRPAYSVLNIDKYSQFTNHRPRPWEEVLNDYLNNYVSIS